MNENTKCQIEYHFRRDEFSKVEKLLLPQIRKYKTFSESNKTFFIKMLINIGRASEALQLFGQECKSFEDENIELLKRQTYLAQLKIKYGSPEIACRIFQKVEEKIKQISFEDIAIKKAFLSVLISNYRLLEKYDKVLELKTLYPIPTWDNPIDYYFHLELIEINCILKGSVNNDFQEIIKTHANYLPDNSLLKFIIQAHAISTGLLLNHFDEKSVNYIKETYQQKVIPTHRAFIVMMRGIISLLVEKDLITFSKCFYEALSQSTAVQEKLFILFWINATFPDTLLLSELIFLRCAPFNTIETLLAGNKICPLPDLIPPVYVDYIPKQSLDDCWLITPSKMYSIKYSQVIKNNNEILVDLLAGLIIENGKVIKLLSEQRVHLLRTIIATGSNGAHSLLLCDVLFEDKLYYYSSALQRLKNMIIELKKLGFRINRKNNSYFYDLKNTYNIIFPKDHKYKGPAFYVHNITEGQVNRDNLEKILNLKRTAAYKYLNAFSPRFLEC